MTSEYIIVEKPLPFNIQGNPIEIFQEDSDEERYIKNKYPIKYKILFIVFTLMVLYQIFKN